MAKRTKKPKSVLKLPDLDYSKSSVLNSLPSLNSRRSYEHAIRDFIDWYCSEPRLAFSKNCGDPLSHRLGAAEICALNDQSQTCGGSQACI
jgi:hypothetical protein